MKAITVKHLGPTTTRGARLKATDYDGNNLTLPRDYSSEIEEDMRRAAEALRRKMNWPGKLRGGCQKLGVYVFIFV